MLLLALGSSCAALPGCDTTEPKDEDNDAVALRTDATWDPQEYTRWHCDDPEQPYSRPPTNGYCDVDLRLVETAFVTGQGASEGRGELSTKVTATPVVGPGAATIASVPESTFSAGEPHVADLSLGTYRVYVDTIRDIRVCATFTEHDNGGSNGGDDVGSDCGNIRLSCSPTDGQVSEEAIFAANLCGDNTCLGSASATVSVKRTDADLDGVPNEVDFTPEPCDELNKGLGGRAVLLYFHYGDDKFTSFFQSAFTNLSQVYGAYDYVVLVADNEATNRNNSSAAAFAQADRVFPPTREGLLGAMQHLTAEHYNFDVFVHAHGYKTGDPVDSKFEVVSGHSITGNWLESSTEPDNIGTARGGIPILAYWSTTCIAARQIDAWTTIGTKVISGAIDVQFFPTTWGDFVENWVGGDPYREAVDGSLTVGAIGEASALIAAQGSMPPYLCIGEDSVLLDNVCADDFFNSNLGPNDAAYNIWEVYSQELPGEVNMLISSTRVFMGNTELTFDNPFQVWP